MLHTSILRKTPLKIFNGAENRYSGHVDQDVYSANPANHIFHHVFDVFMVGNIDMVRQNLAV